MMLLIADKVVVGYANPGRNLNKILTGFRFDYI